MLERFLKTFELTPPEGGMILIGFFFTLILAKVLGTVLFTPFQKLVERREALTVGSRKRAALLIDEAKRLNERADEKLSEVRREALLKKTKLVTSARREADGLLARAERESQQFLAQERSKQAESLQTLKEAMQNQTSSFAGEVVSRILQ